MQLTDLIACDYMKGIKMTDKELKEDVKMKLRMYNPYTKRIRQCMLEIETRIERMKKTQGSFVKAPDGSHELDIHKNTPLWEEIYKFEEDIQNFSITIDQVNNFLSKLNDNQRTIVKSLYMAENKVTQKELADKHTYSREGLRNKVDRLIVKYWKY